MTENQKEKLGLLRQSINPEDYVGKVVNLTSGQEIHDIEKFLQHSFRVLDTDPPPNIAQPFIDRLELLNGKK